MHLKISVILRNLRYFFDRYDHPVFCWDTGHENCYTDGIKHMELFGDRLGALHIHDNRCVWDSDDHILPYDGAIDFDKVARYIAKSGYEGTVMLEVCRNPVIDGKNVYEALTDEEYVERATSAVKKIADRIEEIRKEGK